MLVRPLLIVCLLFGSQTSFAESPNKSYQIIAGFLLQFTSFVDWPNENNQGINLCLVGHDPFGDYIDAMVGARPTNRKGQAITIKRIAVGDSISECHLIFSTQKSVNTLFWETLPKNHSILLVSEYSDFTKQGGLISVYKENKRMRLEVNLESVKKAKLNISSQLLKLAIITKKNQGAKP